MSLAKGPVGTDRLALLAFGVLAFIFGGHSFVMDFPSGTQNGKTLLGLEVNAWSPPAVHRRRRAAGLRLPDALGRQEHAR